MTAQHVTTQRLRFCDTDRLGHVNNAVYAVMLEAGRSELMDLAGLLDPAGGCAVVIVRLELDFLREMNWPGEVTIETAVHRIGTKSMHLRQHVSLGGEITARATSVLAVIDVATRRAVAIRPAWRESLAAYLVPDLT